MNEMYAIIVGGVIGISGTLLGALITYWLDLRRDRILQEIKAKKETKNKLLEGVLMTSEKHGRTQVPFSGGNSLYFPTKRDTPEITLEKIRKEISEIDSNERRIEVIDALELFFKHLQSYLHPDSID